MKLIVLTVAALLHPSCAVPLMPGDEIPQEPENEIPQVPGDNSHYVDGKSRYIWMPDYNGIPQLVDLQEPVDDSVPHLRNDPNRYLIFTRRNPDNAQVITRNVNSVRNSNYNSNLPLLIIVHGWNGNSNHRIIPQFRDAYLAVTDGNVLVVDWSKVALQNYVLAVRRTSDVGWYIGDFLAWLLVNIGGNLTNTHIVGYSLGAHVAGNAGRAVNWYLMRHIGRMTGLDSALPLMFGNSDALNSHDATFVEIIHTDGGSLGIFYPHGAVDFYPNGGRHPQPGCPQDDNGCSHARAPEFFASSIRRPNHFMGRRCMTLAHAENVDCTGTTLPMGNTVPSKRGLGMHGMRTTDRYPY